MSLSPTDKKVPFDSKEDNFHFLYVSPLQLITNVGLFLREPVFTHGQLYVALSRVKIETDYEF